MAAELAVGIENGELPACAGVTAIARFYVTVEQGMSIQARDGADGATLEGIARARLSALDSLISTTS